jgi:hypothetical protein
MSSMPSKRELVLQALHARLTAVPLARVERNRLRPERIPPEGLIILRDGEIGEAEVLLSPLSYIWTHTARLEVFSASGDPDAHLDTLLTSIATVLGVDPALGGEIDQIEIGAPDFDGAAPEGGPDVKAAVVPVRLIYETAHPLN